MKNEPAELAAEEERLRFLRIKNWINQKLHDGPEDGVTSSFLMRSIQSKFKVNSVNVSFDLYRLSVSGFIKPYFDENDNSMIKLGSASDVELADYFNKLRSKLDSRNAR